MSLVDALVARGEIGGRTVQIGPGGSVECVTYPVPVVPDGAVRVRSVSTAVSPGTELSYIGGTNPYLHKRWDEELRLFVAGDASVAFPIVFGYRASGEVVETRTPGVPVGTRVFGRWRHTEFTLLGGREARAQRLPRDLSHDDGVDLAHMAPIAINAALHAESAERGGAAVVFGAGPIGLIAAQALRAQRGPPVYVVDRIPSRLAIAEGLRFPTLAADGRDVALELKRAHGAAGIDVALECSGSTAALHEAIRAVRRRGIVVAVGFYQGEAKGLFLGDEFHHNAVRVVAAQIGNVLPGWSRETLARHAIELVVSGELVLGGLPRLRLPVERAAEGFAELRHPEQVLQVAFSYA